jgi:hypothetical protein
MTAPDPPAPTGTLRALAAHLVRAVQPLDDAFRDPEAFGQLMFQLGWHVDGLPPQYVSIADQVVDAARAIAALAEDAQPDEVLAVIGKVGDVYQSVRALGVAPPGVDPGAFLPEIGRRLFEHLLARDLRLEAPRWYNMLFSLGVIGYEDTPAAGGRPGYSRLRFDWDQIPAILSDPLLIPQRLYGWGTPDFSFTKLATVLAPLLHSVGVPVSIDRVGVTLSSALQSGATSAPVRRVEQALTLPIFDVPVSGGYEEVGFLLAGLPAEGTALPGLILQILAPEGLAETVELGGSWSFTLRAGTDLAQQLAVVIRPGETLVRYPFAPGTQLPTAGFGMALAYQAGTPTLLFGQPKGTRLELDKAALTFGVDEKAGEVEVSAGASVDGLALVLNTADLDGFLGGMLGGHEMRVPAQLGVAWSSRTGLSFLAGAGFSVALYPHLDLGVLRFDRIDLAVRLVTGTATSAPELDVQALLSFSGEVGPVSYAVDRIGTQLRAELTDGNAGPFDLDLGPVWPTGLGLGIDAGPVSGGGFVSYDPDKGRHVGILTLELFDIGVTAIAVLDTRDASGAPLPGAGYSFVLIVSADLPPIQLGWGFTLNAVGGIAALNRRLDSAAVLAGIRQGGLQALLFPADPIRDATTIVAGIGAIFPTAMGRHVFGPTAVIGWGTPTLVAIEVAIVVEVPAPIVLTLLGSAAVVLPDPDDPIVELHVDVVGVWDSGQRTLAVDASLHDSHVAGFTLSGDMAMRLRYGDDPAFAIAVGGFNPHFTPPPGFPTLRRVTVALGADDNPRITIEGYLAVTSNSRQFGAKAELYAAAGGFNVHGWLSFDALLVLHPFSFRFDFSVAMSLNHGSSRIAGVTVSGTLTGPNPFHAWGEGSLSLLFFDVSVPFDATFGSITSLLDLVPLDPWSLLSAAIRLLDNWTGQAGARRSVPLAPATPAGTLVDPAGSATLRQRVLPLFRTLELFGQYAVKGPDTFGVAQVLLGTGQTPKLAHFTTVTDYFAPGDFEKLSATDQISRDSFELMDCGVTVESAVAAPVDAVKVAGIGYQTKIIDSSWHARPLPVWHLGLAAQLAVAQSGSAASGRSRFARRDGRTAGVVLQPETYLVASTDTLTARPDIAAPGTKGAALSALRRSAARGFQVVPRSETEPSG